MQFHTLIHCILLKRLDHQSIISSSRLPHRLPHTSMSCRYVFRWVFHRTSFAACAVPNRFFLLPFCPFFLRIRVIYNARTIALTQKCIIEVSFSSPNIYRRQHFENRLLALCHSGFCMLYCFEVIWTARHVAKQAHLFHLMRFGETSLTFYLKVCGWSLFMRSVQNKFQS